MPIIKKLGLKASVAALALSSVSVPQAAMAQSDAFLGQLTLYPYSFCPKGWTEANGQLLAISSYTALYSLLGNVYGGDGRTTFGLPDLRGRTAIGVGQGPGLSNVQLGQRGGLESVTQNAAQLAPHNHGATTNVTVNSQLRAYNSRAGNTGTAQGNVPSTASETVYNAGPADVDMGSSAISTTASGTTTIGNAGSGQAMSVRNPYLGLRWCIALQGIYPSRN
jgi:microcystin-dependent protein